MGGVGWVREIIFKGSVVDQEVGLVLDGLKASHFHLKELVALFGELFKLLAGFHFVPESCNHL